MFQTSKTVPNVIVSMYEKITYLHFLSTFISLIPLQEANEFPGMLNLGALNDTHSAHHSSLSGNIPTNSSTPSNLYVPCRESREGKEELCRCPSFIQLDPDEFKIVNGTAYVEVYNKYYSSSSYELKDSFLWICRPGFEQQETEEKTFANDKYSTVLVYITIVGLCLSIVCIFLHLLAFVFVSKLRNIPGCCMACLCVSLLSGYVSFLVGFDDYIIRSGSPCVATAFSTHLFFLSSLLWMNVVAFDFLKSLLNATRKLRVLSSKLTFRNFYVYCLYAWGIALVFAIAAVISDNEPNFPNEYRPHFGERMCWFQQGKALLVFFAAPLFALICINIVFFGVSAYIITTNRLKSTGHQESMLKRNLIMYSRLAVIMGLSWIFGLLAGVLDKIALWYIFVILNTFQGFLIFLSFTCKQKVKRHFLRMLGSESANAITQTGSREKSTGNVRKDSDFRRTGKF